MNLNSATSTLGILAIIALIIIFGIIFFIVVIDSFLNCDYELTLFCLNFFVLFVLVPTIILSCTVSKKDDFDTANEAKKLSSSKEYTVYLDGNKVSCPDTLDFQEYKVKINDEKKQIILTK